MQLPDPFSLSLSDQVQDAALLTIVLAFAGYLVAFISTRMLAGRQDKLRLVNMRLNEFRFMSPRKPAISPTARCSRSRARRRANPSATRT